MENLYDESIQSKPLINAMIIIWHSLLAFYCQESRTICCIHWCSLLAPNSACTGRHPIECWIVILIPVVVMLRGGHKLLKNISLRLLFERPAVKLLVFKILRNSDSPILIAHLHIYHIVTAVWLLSCRPHRLPWTVQPTRLLCPWDFPGWSRLPLPFPGVLPHPEIEPASLASLLHYRHVLYHWTTGEAHI